MTANNNNDPNLSVRMNNLIRHDFETCATAEEFSRFLRSYSQYPNHPLVKEAQRAMTQQATSSIEETRQKNKVKSTKQGDKQFNQRLNKKVLRILFTILALCAIGGCIWFSYTEYRKAEDERYVEERTSSAIEKAMNALNLAETQLPECIELDNQNQKLCDQKSAALSRKYHTNATESIDRYNARVRQENYISKCRRESATNCTSAGNNLARAKHFLIEGDYDQSYKYSNFVGENLISIRSQNSKLKTYEPW